MLRSYFLIAIRNLYKHRFYSIINILGLTVGIAACLVIMAFVKFELSFDRFNVHADRIYRVDWELFLSGNHTQKAAVTPPMAEVLVNDYPEIEAACRFRYWGAYHFKVGENITKEWRVVWADNSIFRIFTFDFLAGDPATALKDPNSMVITESCAEQFFPGENALGKTLLKDNKDLYQVTGIITDLPENSHFRYRMFLSMEGLPEARNGYWIGGPYNTYLLLREGADPEALEAKLPGMLDKYLIPQAASVLGHSFMEDFKSGNNSLLLHLRPLLDIHLYSHLQNELAGNGDITYVYLLSAIALFILIIACINFMNLATARSATRAREVGIRKVMGSDRKMLVVQFLAESMILSALAFFLALGITELILPAFNDLIGFTFIMPWNQFSFYVVLILAILITGLFAGFYPALVLSGFRAATVLKGALVKTNQSFFLRRSLVVFQFFISVFMIILTVALHQQMAFIRNKKLGFKKENVIIVRDVGNVSEVIPSIREEILKNHFVMDGTITSYLPGPNAARKTPLIWKYGSDPTPENSVNAETWTVDEHYIPTLGMELVSGRNFSLDFPSDSTALILNETAVREFGYREDPVGQRITMLEDNEDGSQDWSKQETRTIIGIVKDFNFESLHQPVGPLALMCGKESKSFLIFRYDAAKTEETIELIKDAWNKMVPGEPFSYSFLDQGFEQLYSSEKKLGKLFTIFSSLAVFIACMGLFAMTAFTTQQRTKEIGIRKTMGASARNIILLLSKEFSRLIIISFIFAVPLAWYGIQWYLQKYAYKTTISPLIYLGAGFLVFSLASLTMFYQSYKAASANPVDSIRNE